MSKGVIGLLLCAVFARESKADTFVSIGDSITSGTHAEPDTNHGFHYSWANGDLIERNFASQTGMDVALNISLPGAITEILGYQVAFAEHVEANYVSILAGSNDMCWGRGHKVLDKIREYVARLSEKPHVKRILVGTIPDLEQVYQIGRLRPYCAAITAVMCPNFFPRPLEYRQGVMKQIKDVNAEIKALEAEFPKLTVIDQLDEQVYLQEDISVVDCFHPSKVGQQKIADAFADAFFSNPH